MPKERYSKELINVMERMLCKETATRPTAADLLKDEIFRKHESPVSLTQRENLQETRITDKSYTECCV